MAPHIPRGISNQNPGNVRKSQIAWQGEIHPGTDPDFCQFDTMQNGVRCTAKILLNYQTFGLHTIRGIINRWAPPVENNTGAYVNDVAAQCGVNPDTTIVSLTSGEILDLLCNAIFKHENGGDFVSQVALYQGIASAIASSL